MHIFPFFVDLVVSRGATNGLETLVSEMVYYALRGRQTLHITIFYLVTVRRLRQSLPQQ